MEPEAAVRLVSFLTVVFVVGLLEIWRPRRKDCRPSLSRWLVHSGLTITGNLVTRLCLPVAAAGAAVIAGTHQIGLLPLLSLPPLLEVVVAIIALDLVIYWQHRLFHKVPLLWRLHRVHHSDTAFNASTALRFHPLEILISMVIKIAAVATLGAPLLAVILFEVILSSAALFNHSNLLLPFKLDHLLRTLIVTPDMHRIHHSSRQQETDSNFGFNLSIWDRLFATYTKAPKAGQERMTIGLAYFRDNEEQKFGQLITQPFRKENHQPDPQKPV